MENHSRPERSVTSLLLQEQHDGKLEDTKQHTVQLVDESTFRGNEEPIENILLEAPTTAISQFSNILMPPTNVAIARMYEHQEPREPYDSSPIALNNPGKLSVRPRFKVSATLLAAVEDSHRCNKSQPRNKDEDEELEASPAAYGVHSMGASAAYNDVTVTLDKDKA